jgi:polysaccharide export outer membrane protein
MSSTLALLLVALVLVPMHFKVHAQSVGSTSIADAPGDDYFKNIYRDFYHGYKLGPGDLIAIRILNQPDYSLDQVRVSPMGRIYQPLVGEVDVAGLTVPVLTRNLTASLSEFIIDPKVTVSLLEANSAKIGVIGDVRNPGIVVLTRPMTLLDAINERGGVTDFGSKSNITIVRQAQDGRMRTIKANIKRVLQGKADPEENIAMQAGDTVVVHGNFKKTFAQISSFAGFGYFLSVIAGRVD